MYFPLLYAAVLQIDSVRPGVAAAATHAAGRGNGGRHQEQEPPDQVFT